MLSDAGAVISAIGGSHFWNGLAIIAGIGSVIPVLVTTLLRLSSVARLALPFGRAARLRRLKRFREIVRQIAPNTDPLVQAALENQNVARWHAEYMRNVLLIGLNLTIASLSENPKVNLIAAAAVAALAYLNTYWMSSAAFRSWETATWTAYPRAWRRVFLSEVGERKRRKK